MTRRKIQLQNLKMPFKVMYKKYQHYLVLTFSQMAAKNLNRFNSFDNSRKSPSTLSWKIT